MNIRYLIDRVLVLPEGMLLQLVAFAKSLRNLWWGALWTLIYLLLKNYLEAPEIWTLADGQYRKGILTIMMIAWVAIFWAHVLQRQDYVMGDDDDTVETFPGNANWVSAVLALVATFIFLTVGTPKLALVLLGPMQIVPFFLGANFQEQSENELPRLANLALVALSVWLLAFN